MITTDELIGDFTEEHFTAWCRGRFADFVPKAGKLPAGEFSGARQIGYVRTLADGELNRPLLVVAVQVDGELSERSSRKRQFEFARKALKRAAESPPGTVKGVMSQGLFVFCGENGDFRMSLVTGRVEGGKPVYNSFKRQTFFVRHDEVNRTFRDQTAQEFGDFKALCEAFSIEALAKQFYKELFAWYEWALSDEMDVRYPNDIHTDKDNRDLIPEHMIRLITRLMFVWFIKQKKLVPDEIFRVGELRKLLKDFDPESETEGNYYNAILQNLFFATLNNKIEDRDFATNGTTRAENENHYGVKTLFRNPKGGSWFKVPDARILKLFEKVPFLNGGLFECLDRPEDEKSKRILYYDGFSREEKVKGKLTRAFVPNGLFFDEERGLIPLFQRYNFTVEENSPNDAVVALDPELLGKVFENLLGAYNPETQETARKQSGSFYTPREIVSYMVDESLKQYLKTRTGVDDAVLAPLFEEEAKADLPAGKRKELAAAIRSVKILDPACGSGAFPMGALHRLVDLLAKLEGQPESLYDLKLHLIENCIYGVDIQTIAVQISKLRFFISLVCEQEPNGRKADNYGILPLPNLETKFVAANTLIGLEKEMGDELHLADEEISRLREELKEVRHQHFSSKSSFEKRDLRKRDKELRQKIEKRIVSVASTPNLEKIANLEAQIRKLEAEKAKFAGEKWVEKPEAILLCEDGHVEPVIRIDENMAQRKRFQADIDRKKHEIDAEKRKKATDVLLEEAEKLAKWNPYDQNESSPFFDPEWMFGMEEGFDVAIGNPPYLNVELVPPAQKEFYQQHYTTFYKRYDVFGLFFEAALTRCVSRDGKVSFIIPQQIANNLSYKKLRDLILKNSWLAEVLYLGDKVFEAANNDVCVLILDKSGCKTIRLIHALDFISRTVTVVPANHFERYGNVISFSGDSGGEAIFAKVFSNDRWQIKERFSVFQGIVTGNNEAFLPTNEQIREARIEKSLLRPVLLGRDFEKWAIRSTERRIIYVNGDTDIKKYPNAERWLAQFRQSLKKRRECVNGVIPWFSLQWPRAKDELDRLPKIMVQRTRNPRLATRIVATMDDEMGIYGMESIIFLVPKDAKAPIHYLLAVLNSKLINHLYATKYLNVAVKAEYLKDTPIPRAEPQDEKALDGLARRILAARKADFSADTSKWEQEIDSIVYKLYGLTPAEIAVVESACSSPKKAAKQTKPPRRAKAKSKSVLVDDEGLD